MYKKVAMHLLVLILISCTPSLAVALSADKCAHIGVPGFIQGGEGSSIQAVSSDQAVEVLHGKRAVDYLEVVEKEKPERFKKAELRLKELGYKPTTDVVVFRTVNIAKSGSKGPQNGNKHLVLPAQDTYSDSEGEVIFWSWDDGDDGTWEGITSAERYSDGAYATYESQVLIVTENYETVWEEQTSYYRGGSDGGGGGGDEGPGIIRSALPGLSKTSLQRAVLKPGNEVQGNLRIMPAQSRGNFSRYLLCVAAGCISCTQQCRYTGPLWSKCMGLCCGIWVVRCGMSEMIRDQ